MFRGFATILALALLLQVPFHSYSAEPFQTSGSQILIWRKGETVDAHLKSWALDKVLGRLATLTGWKVYMEPGLDTKVSVEFKRLSQGDALRSLLASVNYALVPDANGSTKLYVYRNQLSDAVTLITPDADNKSRNWLANEIILTAKPGKKADVEKIARELGGKVIATSDELNAYRLSFDSPEAAQAAREKLAEDPNLSIQDNFAYSAPQNPALSQSTAPSSTSSSSTSSGGKQVVIALIDTPVQSFGNNSKLLPSIQLAGDPGNLPADPTHGTAMASVIWEQFPDAIIRPIDIYGPSGTTTSWDVANGIIAAMNSTPRPDIINISSGGAGGNELGDIASRNAAGQGMLLFAAAGNSGTDQPIFPAAYPSFIAVTAAHNGVLESYANYGSFVRLANEGSYYFQYMGDNYISRGTSPASAATSGAAAGLLSQGMTPAQTISALSQKLSVQK